MSQNESGTALIEATNETAPTEWGTRAAIKENADRIRRFMPGGDKLTDSQSLVAAQYAHLADANIFRGEIYVYPDKGGNLVLVDGYKLLVRWARRQCQFYDRYDKLEGLEDGDIGYRCRLLRNDAWHHLLALTNAGCDFEFAFDLVTSSAVGIVRKADMWSTRHNKPIPPPKGWNWDQVARKRALKNTLNIAYGMPSPREIAAEGWKVGDTHGDENPDRIDFTAMIDGRVTITKMRRDASASRDIPIESETKSVDFDLTDALAWCERNGYTVRQWYGGARAWKGPAWVIRTRRQIVQKRRELEAQALAKLRQNPGKWHREESHLALDLAYDG